MIESFKTIEEFQEKMVRDWSPGRVVDFSKVSEKKFVKCEKRKSCLLADGHKAHCTGRE